MKERFHNRQRLWLIACAVLLVAGIALAIALRRPQPETPPTPDAYSPYPIDAGVVPAEQIEGLNDLPTLDAEVYKMQIWPELTLDGAGVCPIRFVNNRWNDCYLLFDLRVAQTNTLIYRSGMVPPGQALPSVTLSDDALALLRETQGDVAITLQVYSFALEDYQSCGEISLTLTMRVE